MCRSIIAVLYLSGHSLFATSSWSLISVPLTKVIEAIFSVAFVGFSVQGSSSRLANAPTPFHFQSKLLYVTSPEGKHKGASHRSWTVPPCLGQMRKIQTPSCRSHGGFLLETLTVCLRVFDLQRKRCLYDGSSNFPETQPYQIIWGCRICAESVLQHVFALGRRGQMSDHHIHESFALSWHKNKKSIPPTSHFMAGLSLTFSQHTCTHTVTMPFPWRCTVRGGRVKDLQSRSPLCCFLNFSPLSPFYHTIHHLLPFFFIVSFFKAKIYQV